MHVSPSLSKIFSVSTSNLLFLYLSQPVYVTNNYFLVYIDQYRGIFWRSNRLLLRLHGLLHQMSHLACCARRSGFRFSGRLKNIGYRIFQILSYTPDYVYFHETVIFSEHFLFHFLCREIWKLIMIDLIKGFDLFFYAQKMEEKVFAENDGYMKIYVVRSMA